MTFVWYKIVLLRRFLRATFVIWYSPSALRLGSCLMIFCMVAGVVHYLLIAGD